MPLKLEKGKNGLFLQNHFPLHHQTLSNMLWFYENDSYSERYVLRHLQRQQTHLIKIKDAM